MESLGGKAPLLIKQGWRNRGRLARINTEQRGRDDGSVLESKQRERKAEEERRSPSNTILKCDSVYGVTCMRECDPVMLSKCFWS